MIRPVRPLRVLPMAAALASAAAFAAGCGDDESSDEQAATTATTASAPQSAEAKFGRATLKLSGSIAELRGHYIAAKELYAAGDRKGAKVHADHPVEELYRSFRQVVAERDPALDKEIKGALDEAVELIDTKAPAARFATRVDETAGTLMDRVLTLAHPDVKPDDPQLTAAVAATIVSTAADEYAAAIPKDRVKLTAEYQDSYGFVQYCKLLVGKLDTELGDQRDAVATTLAALESGPYASKAEPPSKPLPATDVARDVDSLVQSLETGTGSKLLPAEQSPAQELKAVADGLDEALALYERGDKEGALDAAAVAYVDRFEGLEGDLAAENLDLMLDLEKRIALGVRDTMRAGKDAAELERQIAAIKRLLPEAEKALGGSGKTAY